MMCVSMWKGFIAASGNTILVTIVTLKTNVVQIITWKMCQTKLFRRHIGISGIPKCTLRRYKRLVFVILLVLFFI